MACNKPIAGLLHRYPIGSYRAVQFIAVNTLIFFFVINFLPLLYKIKKGKKRKKQNKIINPTVCWIWSSNKPNYDFKWLCVNGRQSLSFKYQHLIMILLLESKHQISKRLNVGYDGPLVAEGRGGEERWPYIDACVWYLSKLMISLSPWVNLLAILRAPVPCENRNHSATPGRRLYDSRMSHRERASSWVF